MKEAELREHLRGYYDEGLERDRLAQDRGLLEWARSTEVILRHLPAPPAVVADIGGGPGPVCALACETRVRGRAS